MVRLDDDELNINPQVAAALAYPRQGNARGRRNARGDAQRRYAHGRGDGFLGGFFGAFGVALLLLLIICTVVGVPRVASRAGSTVKADSHPQTSVESREGQPAAEERPAAQPQAPQAIEATNPEIASQQTMQPPPQPEPVPDSVEATSVSDSAESEKPEITVKETVQEEPVVFLQPPEQEQQEKKVELPMTKRYGQGGVRPLLFRTGDGFVYHATVCAAPSEM